MPADHDPDDFSHLPQVDDSEPRLISAPGSTESTTQPPAEPRVARRIVVPASTKPAPPPEEAPAAPKKKIRLKLPIPVAAKATAEPETAASETEDLSSSEQSAQEVSREEDASAPADSQPEESPSQEEPDSDREKSDGVLKIIVNEASGEVRELTQREKFLQTWEKIGGRSLSLSLAIHALILVIAAFVVVSYTQNERIDFMPGGGTRQGEAASQALEQTVQRKKTPWMNRKLPMQRIAVEKSMSAITLPEASPEMLELPMSQDFLSGGKMGSMGFGSAGAGGGFGNGIGTGGKSGVTFGPIMMFGKKINAKRIAVVLDVSRSMTPYLEKVVNELDRVARGSTVVLYYGCGLLRPDGRIDETVQRTQSKDFERFWRIWQGSAMLGFSGQDLKKITFAPSDPIPLENLYRFLSRRLGTYFLDYNGMDFAWSALLSNEVRSADAVYWFADFEDNVDNRQMKTLAENMRLRRQRLFIHPQVHGASFEDVVDKVVKVTGGEVIEPDEADKVSAD
jgi:hypothetical protein